MKNSINIALLGGYFNWGGGVEFLRYFTNGLLSKQKENNFSLFLLLPVDNRIESIKDFVRLIKKSLTKTFRDKHPYIVKPFPAYHESMIDFFSQIQGKITLISYTNNPDGLKRALKIIKANVGLPVNGTLGSDFFIPWIGYLPDFQHKYFPGNFSAIECFEREIRFAESLRDSSVLIVNSQQTKNDILNFYPYVQAKIFNLPFSPNPMQEWFLPHPEDIKTKYNLPKKYFLISNQFWIHKDHLTAFKALKKIRSESDINILCTGSLNDYRWPEHITELKKYLMDNGLTENVKLLGHIPKRDQIEIMKGSVAIVQPTLFEGGPGGGSVYDAVSLGIPAILSNIPINYEVTGDNIFYFKAGDYVDLANKMHVLLESTIYRPAQDILLKKGQENLARLGDCLMEAVNYIV